MELVDSRPLVADAHEHHLTVADRFALLVKVCDGVQHAHTTGIIHCDLKPANVLVTAEGPPKIHDFGVARAVDADLQSTTLQSDLGQVLGTLPYLSPEQAGGDPSQVDTRVDV